MAIKRAIIHCVIYFTLFTLMVVVVRSTNTVPEYGLPIVAAFYLTFVYAFQCFRLTVSRPESQFAYPDSLRRCLRLIIYMGWYMLLVLIPGAYLGNKESMFSWFIGMTPPMLYLCMAQTLRPPVKLVHLPKSRDSRWRSAKYLGLMVGWQLLLAIPMGIFGIDRGPDFIAQTAVYLGSFSIIIVCVALYRLVVAKPHSRFDSMTKKERYKRLAGIIAAYLILGVIAPYIVQSVWRMNGEAFNHTLMLFVIFFTAAYGSDATPFKGVGFFAKPPNTGAGGPTSGGTTPTPPLENRERQALRRKILKIKRRNEAAGRAKAASAS